MRGLMAGARGPLLLATRNSHKLQEFQRLLAPAGIDVVPLPDGVQLPPEVGDSFEANALPKARTAAAATGLASIADDSGIEAEAIGGRPGVRSARYAGPNASDLENLDKLRAEVPPGTALRYVCALAWAPPGAAEHERVFFGRCSGRMAATAAGAGGFGYDPVFVPDGEQDGRTMAQLDDAAKDAISHRGRAVAELLAWLTRSD
ncbi:MAG: non-canonical purine NTP pyrophosphatase [Solirubrobacteraceae bacterium]